MPIAVRCQCGKSLNVRDDLAGKAIKCPGCQQVVRVPANAPQAVPSKATAKTNPTGAARPVAGQAGSATPATAPSAMDSLLNQAGFEFKTGSFCPQCMAQLAPGAVLCTKCGFHLEAGTVVQGHSIQLEEEGAEAYLKRAQEDMRRSAELQERLKAAGMPPWIMALILFGLVSLTAVSVFAVNISRRKDSDVSFNATATLLLLAGIAASAVYAGAYLTVIVRAFKESSKQGLLSLFAPFYVFYFAFSRFKKAGVTFIVALLALGAAITFFVLANLSNMGQL